MDHVMATRRIAGVDGPGDCDCCGAAGTPTSPVYLAHLTDPEDGTLYEVLCRSCFDDVETDIVGELLEVA